MVLFKSIIKFIVNPLAIVFALILVIFLAIVFLGKGFGMIGKFFLAVITCIEDFLGDSWLGKKYSGMIDVATCIFE